MKIQDMRKGAKVTITATKGLKQMQFESQVIFSNNEGLFIEPIRYENTLISFMVSDYVFLNALIVDVNEIPYEWKNVVIKTVKYEGKTYNLIITEEEVQNMNRRNGYRQFMGISGVAQFGENKCAYDVIVKDISELGIGILCSKDLDVKEHDVVHVQFVDNDNNAKFSLKALVVRKVVKEEKTLYGCKLLSQSNAIRKYIIEKQQSKLINHYRMKRLEAMMK